MSDHNTIPIKKRLTHLLEYLIVMPLLQLCRLLPVSLAAGLGSFLFRMIGPMTRGQRIARRNLQRAFPDMDAAAIERILRGMWDHLGRCVGEWMHLDRLDSTDPARLEIQGEAVLLAEKDTTRPSIFMTAHLGHWELLSPVMAQRGIALSVVYRYAANPHINRFVRRLRARFGVELLHKGRRGVRDLLGRLKDGRKLGIMVDQKFNEGVPIRFFGRDAMTPTAPAELALRFQCNMIPIQITRLAGGRHRIIFHPPIPHPDTGDVRADAITMMTAATTMIEGWIRETPEQWFWVHRRWPD